jgi:hypothetical protein
VHLFAWLVLLLSPWATTGKGADNVIDTQKRRGDGNWILDKLVFIRIKADRIAVIKVGIVGVDFAKL